MELYGGGAKAGKMYKELVYAKKKEKFDKIWKDGPKNVRSPHPPPGPPLSSYSKPVATSTSTFTSTSISTPITSTLCQAKTYIEKTKMEIQFPLKLKEAHPENEGESLVSRLPFRPVPPTSCASFWCDGTGRRRLRS